jgi:hypothetical protein
MEKNTQEIGDRSLPLSEKTMASFPSAGSKPESVVTLRVGRDERERFYVRVDGMGAPESAAGEYSVHEHFKSY